MRNYDLSPLFRSTVGFDRLTRLMESALASDEAGQSYPPYNIEKLGDDRYRITMAVAGFSPDEIDITVEQGVVKVTGKAKGGNEAATYLHRGIATRAFERRFHLADHIRVEDARLENGLLHVALVREVPEAMKPRKIAVTASATPAPVIEQQAA